MGKSSFKVLRHIDHKVSHVFVSVDDVHIVNAYINHELKTPVASIQVCLETLLSGISLSDEKRLELIERCYMNTERLRRLLADVSLITRM